MEPTRAEQDVATEVRTTLLARCPPASPAGRLCAAAALLDHAARAGRGPRGAAAAAVYLTAVALAVHWDAREELAALGADAVALANGARAIDRVERLR